MCLLKDPVQMKRQRSHLHNLLLKLRWLDYWYFSLFLDPQLEKVVDNPHKLRSCYILDALGLTMS
jgi:hypothetical protein